MLAAAAPQGLIALGHADHDLRIIVGPLPGDTDPSTFPNLQVGFIVEGIDQHWHRLKDTVTIGDSIATIDLGEAKERSFQIIDPNGVIYRLIEFVD